MNTLHFYLDIRANPQRLIVLSIVKNNEVDAKYHCINLKCGSFHSLAPYTTYLAATVSSSLHEGRGGT